MQPPAPAYRADYIAIMVHMSTINRIKQIDRRMNIVMINYTTSMALKWYSRLSRKSVALKLPVVALSPNKKSYRKPTMLTINGIIKKYGSHSSLATDIRVLRSSMEDVVSKNNERGMLAKVSIYINMSNIIYYIAISLI